jgi:maltose O-acetyltransferase
MFNKIKNSIFLYRFKGFIGINSKVERGIFNSNSNIKIGDNCYIGPFSYWDALGGIDIGNNVIIGPKSIIWTYNHNFQSDKLLPYDEVELLKKVKINDNVWIGIDVKIIPGITIGEGVIIAMGSVVVNDIPPLAIVGGNPARVLKYRDQKTYEKIINSDNFSYIKAKSEGLTKKHIQL